VAENGDVVAHSRFNINPRDVLSINTTGKLMWNIANDLYFNPHEKQPAPVRWFGDVQVAKSKNHLKFKIADKYLARLEILPQKFPPSVREFGESSSQRLSTTTDLSNSEDSPLVTMPVVIVTSDDPVLVPGVPRGALQYYPRSTESTGNWGVLAGNLEGRSDPLVAFISSSTSHDDLSHYTLKFRNKEVSTSEYIGRTNDVTAEC
jgi:hypothetical protein